MTPAFAKASARQAFFLMLLLLKNLSISIFAQQKTPLRGFLKIYLIPVISISVYGCLCPIFLLSLFFGLYLKTITLSPFPWLKTFA